MVPALPVSSPPCPHSAWLTNPLYLIFAFLIPFHRSGRYAEGAPPADYSRPPPREQDWRQGDWECPGCKFHNFASRDRCFRCGEWQRRQWVGSSQQASQGLYMV